MPDVLSAPLPQEHYETALGQGRAAEQRLANRLAAKQQKVRGILSFGHRSG